MSRVANPSFGAFGSFNNSSGAAKGPLNSLASKTKESPSAKNFSKIDANDYVPKRFGLKYNPPTIIIEYLVPSSGKLYHHKVKLSHLKAESDTWDALETIKKRNSVYFTGNKIGDNQITELIKKLKKKLQGNSAAGTGGFSENKDNGTKFGKLAPANKPNHNLTSFDINKTTGGSGVKADKKNDSGNNFWAFDDLEDFEDDEEKTDYNSKNLNKLSNEELQKHKNKMDVLFNKNHKKPGDKDFLYDKQEEFVATQDNEWDEEF